MSVIPTTGEYRDNIKSVTAFFRTGGACALAGLKDAFALNDCTASQIQG